MLGGKFTDDGSGWAFGDDAHPPPHAPADVLEAILDAGDERLTAVLAHAGEGAVTEGAGPHKFSSTQIDLNGAAAYRLLELGRTVRDEDLAEDGRENEPHITVRYGLHTENPADVRPILNAFPPLTVTLGRVSVFQVKKPDGREFDVLKVDVEGDGLRRLNAALSALPHTDTFSEYKPHATVAYVRSGTGAGYAAGMAPLDLAVTAHRVTFSDRTGGRASIPLLAVREDAGLTERKVTVHRSDGSSFERTQKVKAGQDAPADAARAGENADEVELHDDDRVAITQGIDRAGADLPPKARAEGGLLEKAKDVALTAAAKVYRALLRATPAMMKVGAILGEVFDTPGDMAKKFGYNPNTSSGTSNARTHDAIASATNDALGVGVSGHIVIAVASHVLSRAVVWAKRKLSGSAAREDAGDGVGEWAQLIAAVFASVSRSLGADAPTPDAAAVEKVLRGLLAGRS